MKNALYSLYSALTIEFFKVAFAKECSNVCDFTVVVLLAIK